MEHAISVRDVPAPSRDFGLGALALVEVMQRQADRLIDVGPERYAPVREEHRHGEHANPRSRATRDPASRYACVPNPFSVGATRAPA